MQKKEKFKNTEIPSDELKKLDYSYIIYKPAGGHKVFRMIKLFRASGKSELIRTPEIEKLNSDFLAGQLTADEVHKEFLNLRKGLYRADGLREVAAVFNSENRKLLNQYWKSEYEFRTNRLVDPKTARYDLERAVDVVGSLSLRTSSRSQLQKEVDKRVSGNKHRRVVSKLNQILKFAKREFTLLPAKKVWKEVRHVTLEEFTKMLPFLGDERIQVLHLAAFVTGCRIGELFALEARTYDPKRNTIKVLRQIDRDGIRRGTKNSRERTAFVLPGSEKVLAKWFELRDKISPTERFAIAKVTKRAAATAFPKDRSKWLTFHDLRHSYSIHLLSKGVPLSQVAQSIGDSIRVAEEHYAGYDLTPTSIDMVNRIVVEADKAYELAVKKIG